MIPSCRSGAALPSALFVVLLLSATTRAQNLSADDSRSFSKPGVAIELIRAAYYEGRDQDAVVLADEALRDSTEENTALQAEIHFWRGASLRRLKRYQEALIALERARDLGFSGLELRLERALTLRALGRQEEAEREFQEAERRAQEDPDKLEDLRKRWRETADLDKKFQLRLYPEFGYDSNIVGIDKDVVLQEEIDRESFYYGLQLSARFLAFQEKEMALILDYRNNVRGYANETGLSFTDNLLSVIWQSPVGKLDWLSYEIRASYGEAWLQDEGHFRTLRSLAPALIFKPGERWQLRLSGDYTNADYYEEAPDEQDRDGDMYRIRLDARIDLGDGWKLAPRIAYWSYRADGDDYDHQAWDLGAEVTTPEFSGFQFRLDMGITFAEYDHPHSLSGFTDERSDRRFSVKLTVIFRQLEKIIGFAPSVSIGYDNWSSNIDAFDFDRFDFGASADILAWSF